METEKKKTALKAGRYELVQGRQIVTGWDGAYEIKKKYENGNYLLGCVGTDIGGFDLVEDENGSIELPEDGVLTQYKGSTSFKITTRDENGWIKYIIKL